MDPIQDFSKVQLTLENVFIPKERLRNTPSSKDGCSHDLEVDLRIVGCEYIQTAGMLLRLPQVAMATAQVLFQRFYYSKSFVKYNMLTVAMACIFLAGKIEENCRRVRDVANVFHHLKQKRMGRPVVPMDYMGEEYFKLKASIIKYERFVLKELGFCVHVKHPHKLIIAYLQILELEKNSNLAQKAWNFMNDSLRTNVFVRFSPETIACACIFLSARQLKIALPQKPPWWTVFEVSFEDIEATSMEILALYRRPRAFYIDLEKKLAVLKEALAKKQVEIKEINLKKKTPAGSDSLNAVNSPGGDSGAETGKEKSLSESPAPSTTVHSKLLPSPLSQAQKASPGKVVSPPLPTSSLANNSSNSLINGNKRPHITTTTSSPIPAPPSKRRRVSRSTSPSMERSKGTGGPSTKPVISPVRCVTTTKMAASSGDSYSDTSMPSPVENGIPEQYRRDFSKHSSSSKSRSKHHHHRHHHHHSSSSSSSSKTHHHSDRRHHHSRHRTQDPEEDEVGRGRRLGRDYHTSSSSSSKSRRTESGRYR